MRHTPPAPSTTPRGVVLVRRGPVPAVLLGGVYLLALVAGAVLLALALHASDISTTVLVLAAGAVPAAPVLVGASRYRLQDVPFDTLATTAVLREHYGVDLDGHRATWPTRRRPVVAQTRAALRHTTTGSILTAWYLVREGDRVWIGTSACSAALVELDPDLGADR